MPAPTHDPPAPPAVAAGPALRSAGSPLGHPRPGRGAAQLLHYRQADDLLPATDPRTVPTSGGRGDAALAAEVVAQLLEVAEHDPDGFAFAVAQVTETTDLLLRLAGRRPRG